MHLLTWILTGVTGVLLFTLIGRAMAGALRRPHPHAPVSIHDRFASLEARMRGLPEAERAVVDRLLKPLELHRPPIEPPEGHLTLGERLADRVALFGGSWTFLACFAAFMNGWMLLNSQMREPADPYPFILLNLVLSFLASVQAPVIMMSQNRQAKKDRLSAQLDYQVNVRAEMQIAALHLKIDDARRSEWQELLSLYREQLERLARLELMLAQAPSQGERS